MRKMIIFIVLVTISNLHSQTSQLTTKLQAIKNNRGVLGMSVTVIKDKGISYSQGFGVRDVGRNLPVNDSTLYRIASISKMVSAVALMQLYERGLINLDVDISTYLGFQFRNPAFPNDVITTRQVISHTASLRDGNGYDNFLSASYNQTPPPNISTLFLPGGTYYNVDVWNSSKAPAANYFQYSNVNFAVIGTLVEKLSNKRFDIYCRENIFIPLGMDASFNIQDIVGFNNLAALYRKNGGNWVAQADNYNGTKPAPINLGQYVIGSNGLMFAPQGGLRTSANDLSKILTALLNGGMYGDTRLLNDSTAALLRKMNWTYNGSNGNNYFGIFNSYSYGQHKTTELLPTETMYGHPGEAYGLISDVYYSFDRRYGIIFITNGGQWGYGAYSGWYDVEEDVFQACLSELNNLTNVQQEENVPAGFSLLQNYPNPFNPATTIVYTLPETAYVKITVFNSLGEEIKQLTNIELPAESHNVYFKPDNLPSGTYLYRLTALTNSGVMYNSERKMIYLR